MLFNRVRRVRWSLNVKEGYLLFLFYLFKGFLFDNKVFFRSELRRVGGLLVGR